MNTFALISRRDMLRLHSWRFRLRGLLRPGGARRDPGAAFCAEGRVHIHDLHATILQCLGLDHEKLTYRYGGRDFRPTDVHGTVVKGILA